MEWTYLTLECRAGDLVVALDVLFDGLARGTVAFFELRNQLMIKVSRWTKQDKQRRQTRRSQSATRSRAAWRGEELPL